MCGFIGRLSLDQKSIFERDINDSLKLMKHRGPDEQKVEKGSYWDFGFCRLSILDLTNSGSQPMFSEDRSSIMLFNGEIYNFIELRNILVKNNIKVKSTGDTEVLLNIIKIYGSEGLKLLNGMFSLAFFDFNKKKLLLARDRAGKKPLIYYKDENKIIFGSEQKAICDHDDINMELDYISINQYFCFGYIKSPRTIFKHLKKLDPGHFIELSLLDNSSDIKTKPYWNLNYNPDYSLSENDWIEKTESILIDAVKMRLRSDVRVGTFLSSGIDSSLITAIASKSKVRDDFCSFTIGFNDKNFDESSYAEEFSKSLGIKHNKKVLEPDNWNIITELVKHFEEPYSDSSAIPTYFLCKAASEFGVVFLSGDGGDELFAGYKRYFTVNNNNWLGFIPLFIKKPLSNSLSSFIPKGSSYYSRLKRAGIENWERKIHHYAPFAGDESNYMLLSENAKKQFKDEAIFEAKNQINLPITTQMQLIDFKYYLSNDILTKVDRASMAHSIEVRSPLLDYRLIEMAFRIPHNYHIKNNTGKNILKKVAKKYIPNSFLNHPKKGFGFPLSDALNDSRNKNIENYFLSSRTKERELYNYKEVQRLYKYHKHSKHDFTDLVWKFIIFEEWCRQFIDS